MAFMQSLEILKKLKPLMSGENLAALDIVLTLLTDPTSRAYNTFWVTFRGTFADDSIAMKTHTTAWNVLKKLHEVVKESRSAQ